MVKHWVANPFAEMCERIARLRLYPGWFHASGSPGGATASRIGAILPLRRRSTSSDKDTGTLRYFNELFPKAESAPRRFQIADRHILVSGLFGTAFSKVYPAVEGRRCVFFSNNPRLEAEIVSKGWEFRMVSGHPLSADGRVSSQQSKYIKFLQFLRDYPEFACVPAITYFDHKFHVTEDHIQWVLAHRDPKKSILIRTTPALKATITDEVNAANGQPRYGLNMARTVQWVERLKTTRGVSESVRIVNTGLIHYENYAVVMPMLDEIYTAVWELGQPECQIIWAALSQAYDAHIQAVPFEALKPKWAAP